jgi:plastocyanin
MRTPAATVLLVGVLVAGCGSGADAGMSGQSPSPEASTTAAPAGGAPVQSATVDIRSFKYKPVTVTVKKGGRVRWTNSDTAAHTATADDRSFDTQTIDKGKARMVAMTTAGTFAYHCDFHPFMKATVVVK